MKGGNKAKIDAEVFELSFNCEKAAIGVSSPGWVGLFAEVEINTSGQVTVFGGVKGGTDGPLPSFGEGKFGFFVKVDSSNGTFTDGGIKTTFTSNSGTGPISIEHEKEMEFGIAGAFEN